MASHCGQNISEAQLTECRHSRAQFLWRQQTQQIHLKQQIFGSWTGPSPAAAAIGAAIDGESAAVNWAADAIAGTALARSPATPAATVNVVNLCA